eukprot:671244_1
MESCTDDKVLFIEAPSLEFLHKKPEWSFKNNVLRRIGLHDLRHVFTLFLILGITMYITYRFELSRMKKGVKLESENEPHISRAKLESENEPRTGANSESENDSRTARKDSRFKPGLSPPYAAGDSSIDSHEKKEHPPIYLGPINSGR